MYTRVDPFLISQPSTSRWISSRYSFASGVASKAPPSTVYCSHIPIDTLWKRIRVFSTFTTFA